MTRNIDQSFELLTISIQKEHYRLDWHRFNLKQRLLGRQMLTAEEFEAKTQAGEEKYMDKSHYCLRILLILMISIN